MTWVCPGYSQVSRHWPEPRCHSMTRAMPDSPVISQPSAQAPMYGYSGVSSHANTERDRLPGRSLLVLAVEDDHAMTAPVQSSLKQPGTSLQRHSDGLACITSPGPPEDGSPGGSLAGGRLTRYVNGWSDCALRTSPLPSPLT